MYESNKKKVSGNALQRCGGVHVCVRSMQGAHAKQSGLSGEKEEELKLSMYEIHVHVQH